MPAGEAGAKQSDNCTQWHWPGELATGMTRGDPATESGPLLEARVQERSVFRHS